MAIFDYEGYNQALSDAEEDRAAAISARNKLRSDLQAKGVTSWRSDPQYQALTNQINQANQTVVILKKNSIEPGTAGDIDFGSVPVPPAATDSRTRLELENNSRPPPPRQVPYDNSNDPGYLAIKSQLQELEASGELATGPVEFPAGSRTTTGTGTTPSGATQTFTYTASPSNTSVPANVTSTTYTSNVPTYTPEQKNRDAYLTSRLAIQNDLEIINDPETSAEDRAFFQQQLAEEQEELAYLSKQPGALGSTVTVQTQDNTSGQPFTTSTPAIPASPESPIYNTDPTADDAAVEEYRANTQASINQQLADRDAYEAGVEGEYDYYENPADDPNQWYDDSLGEYVPRTDRPEDWEARDQNAFVYNDDLGEWVPREDLPENWNDGNTTVTQEPQYDDFGCIIGQEEYDDTDGVCVPIGGTSNYLGEPTPVADEFADVEAEQLFDEFELSFDETPEPPISIREARLSNNRNYDKKDWRFKIRLSPFSDYLYNDPLMHNAHVLAPLKKTDGVIFPYTPSITVPHIANYASYALTHSNYRGFFYQGSQIGDIVVNGTFTAQDTDEANYLLAVIHFFKSATKMFYGQDQRRGVPPPLLYMNGFGDFQFAEHPCVLSTFNYTIPDNVDYVRAYAGPNTNDFVGRTDTAMGYQSWSSKITRLITSKLESGAPPTIPDFDLAFEGVTKISQDETYVPTKIGIQLTFHPVDSRDRISNQFSLRKYAYGDLTKKGFW